MRQRRLQSDWKKLQILHDNSELINVDLENSNWDRFRVKFSCKGLVWLPGAAAPSITTNHSCEIYLHLDYPRTPPQLTWLTDIFHPNILPPSQNGGVCIGYWTPAESIDQLCIRIAEMVQMKNVNPYHPLNPTAAEWVKINLDKLPVDERPIMKPQLEIELV